MREYTAGTVVRQAKDRPEKPWPEFPLFPSPVGYWSKKIGGKVFNFGRWGRIKNGEMVLLPYVEGYTEAKAAYENRIDDIKGGKVDKKQTVITAVEVDEPGLTVGALADRFLKSKKKKLVTGKLSPRSFQELCKTGQHVCDVIGKAKLVSSLGPADFERLHDTYVGRLGPVRTKNEIVRTMAIFNYGIKNELCGKINYGTEFVVPDKVELRKHKQNSDKKLLTAVEIRTLLDATPPSMRAMILLGINGGLGNTDVATLEFSNLDLDGAWLDYPRRKTAIPRRVPLWPETVEALQAVIAERPTPADKADKATVFLTPQGKRLIRVHETTRTDLVTSRFSRLLNQLDITKGRKGIGYYSLRHTFSSIGLQTGDRDAVKALMGQAHGDVLEDAYDETGPSDHRLRAVVNRVRAEIFGGAVMGGAL
jgi:integrase